MYVQLGWSTNRPRRYRITLECLAGLHGSLSLIYFPRGLSEIFQADCVATYPEAFAQSPIPSVTALNQNYGGWSVKNSRLFFANGRRMLILFA
jgi:hypothetical protein